MISLGLNPLAFKAGSHVSDDHKLSLDGLEYEKMPDEIQIPRFFGQGMGTNFPSPFDSMMIFINFTGGAMFRAIADVLIYNDNEQIFSSTVEFDCWDEIDLIDVSGATGLAFLEGTNNDPDEVFIAALLMETGWLRIDGRISYYFDVTFDDP